MEHISRRIFGTTLGSLLMVMTGSKVFGATKPKPHPKKKPVKGVHKMTPTPKPPTPSSSGTPTPTGTPTPSGTPTPTGTPIKLNNQPLSLEQIPVGQSLVANYTDPKNQNAEEIVVHRTSSTTVVAFSAICTHRGCIVEANAPKSFDCPCHGSSFDSTTGGVINGPATRPLAPLSVKVENGNLVIA